LCSMWRWRWDLNPRWSLPHTRFRVVICRVQPCSGGRLAACHADQGRPRPPACTGMTRSEIGSRSSSASAVVVSIAADDRGPRLGSCSRTDRGAAVHDDACEGAARDGLDGQARHEGQRALQGARGLPADPLPAMSRQTAKVDRMALGCSPEGKGTEATHSR
jgi:hypothetical protein